MGTLGGRPGVRRVRREGALGAVLPLCGCTLRLRYATPARFTIHTNTCPVHPTTNAALALTPAGCEGLSGAACRGGGGAAGERQAVAEAQPEQVRAWRAAWRVAGWGGSGREAWRVGANRGVWRGGLGRAGAGWGRGRVWRSTTMGGVAGSGRGRGMGGSAGCVGCGEGMGPSRRELAGTRIRNDRDEAGGGRGQAG